MNININLVYFFKINLCEERKTGPKLIQNRIPQNIWVFLESAIFGTGLGQEARQETKRMDQESGWIHGRMGQPHLETREYLHSLQCAIFLF